MTGLSGKGSRRRNQVCMTQGANAPQVAFTKRRPSLFKKASELCTLFAVETALVIFSSGGKAFSFGHPSDDANTNRLANHGKMDVYAISPEEAKLLASIKQLFKEYSDVREKLKASKLRSEQLQQMKMESQSKGQRLVDRPVDELNLEELLTLQSEMAELREKLMKNLQERLAKPSASTSMSAGGSNASLNGSTDGGSSADPHEH